MFSSGGRKATAARPAHGGGLSFIGADVQISGDLTSGSQIHIDGRIDGNVRCEMLIQGPGGIVAGHIVAEQARIAGLVDGTIRARIVELEPSAKVTGDVTYETLNIAAGAAIEGRLARREGKPTDDQVAKLLGGTGGKDDVITAKPLTPLDQPVQVLI